MSIIIYSNSVTQSDIGFYKLAGSVILDCFKYPPIQIAGLTGEQKQNKINRILKVRIDFAKNKKFISMYSDIALIDDTIIANAIIKFNKKRLENEF